MTENLLRWRTAWLWVAILLLAGFVLAGCGGSTLEAEPAETQPEATEVILEESAAQNSEPTREELSEPVEDVQEDTAVDTDDNALASAQISNAACHQSTPQTDPIVAALTPNEQVVSLANTDWSQGLATAPITIIEYGDFQ